MHKGKLVSSLVKFLGVCAVLLVGLKVVIDGYSYLIQDLPLETKPPFEAEMNPPHGPLVGEIQVSFKPTEAFVVGDRILADIEVKVYWLEENESATIYVIFPEGLSMLSRWAWTETFHYEEMIFLEYNSSGAVYDIYCESVILRYAHEGIFGINVTVYSPYSLKCWAIEGTKTGTVQFDYVGILHIKSTSYLEQQRYERLTVGLAQEVLGLSIIAVSPLAIYFVDTIHQMIEALRSPKEEQTKEKKHT